MRKLTMAVIYCSNRRVIVRNGFMFVKASNTEHKNTLGELARLGRPFCLKGRIDKTRPVERPRLSFRQNNLAILL